jgi:hypothetical protein
MERDDEEQRTVETGCEGGQGSPRAVVPRKKKITMRTVEIQVPLLDYFKWNAQYCYTYYVKG